MRVRFWKFRGARSRLGASVCCIEDLPQMTENMATLGSIANTEDNVDFEEILDMSKFYCLARNDPEAEESAIELKKAGYEVIREDASFTVYAPQGGFPIDNDAKKLEAKIRLKPIRVKADVVRDVRQESIECGNPSDSFHLRAPLPLQPGPACIQQALIMEGTFRSFKVRDGDKSDWARVEVTSLQWNVSPDMVTDTNHLGYFVDSIELHLRPTWESPQASARHAPALEYAAVEETKTVQKEKNVTYSFSLAKAFGATVGGGKKSTTGSGLKTVRNPCKEHWDVVGAEGGSINTCYRWYLNYWEGEEGACYGPQALETRAVLAFPSVPKPTMLTKKASVDWIWPSECEQPPAWTVTVKARVIFLHQEQTKKKFFKSKTKIIPSIWCVEEEFQIEYRQRRGLLYEKLSHFIPLLVVLIAVVIFLRQKCFNTQVEHQLQLL